MDDSVKTLTAMARLRESTRNGDELARCTVDWDGVWGDDPHKVTISLHGDYAQKRYGIVLSRGDLDKVFFQQLWLDRLSRNPVGWGWPDGHAPAEFSDYQERFSSHDQIWSRSVGLRMCLKSILMALEGHGKPLTLSQERFLEEVPEKASLKRFLDPLPNSWLTRVVDRRRDWEPSGRDMRTLVDRIKRVNTGMAEHDSVHQDRMERAFRYLVSDEEDRLWWYGNEPELRDVILSPIGEDAHQDLLERAMELGLPEVEDAVRRSIMASL